MTDTENLICLDSEGGSDTSECKGTVEYRPSMSPTGREFPRCEGHFRRRVAVQERISRTYNTPIWY